MERTKGVEVKKQVGKSKYLRQYSKMVYEIALLCKASDRDLARIFDVAPVTIQNWKRDHPDFVHELERGKDLADSKVAVALIERCLGYEHEETDIKQYKGVVIKTQVIKHYPPDTAAIKFWLTNRQKEHWQETSRVDNSTNLHVTREINLKDIPTEELELAKKLGMRKLINEIKKN